jgi:hypothetical protein
MPAFACRLDPSGPFFTGDIQLETPEGFLQKLQHLRANRRSMGVNEWSTRSAIIDRALVELGSRLVIEPNAALRDLRTEDQQTMVSRGRRGETGVGK